MALDSQSGSSSAGHATAAATAREPEDTASDPAREARIAELRRKYREGQYTINPGAVSERLIEDHLTGK